MHPIDLLEHLPNIPYDISLVGGLLGNIGYHSYAAFRATCILAKKDPRLAEEIEVLMDHQVVEDEFIKISMGCDWLFALLCTQWERDDMFLAISAAKQGLDPHRYANLPNALIDQILFYYS